MVPQSLRRAGRSTAGTLRGTNADSAEVGEQLSLLAIPMEARFRGAGGVHIGLRV